MEMEKVNEVDIKLWMPQIDNLWQPCGAYLMRHQGTCSWLQSTCEWIIRKLGGRFERQVSTVGYTTVNYKQIVDFIRDFDGITFDIWHKNSKYIIVGYHAMEELRKQTKDSIMYLHFLPNTLEHPAILDDLRVICVPWMEGIVVLPDVF